MIMLILTPDERDTLRGETIPYHALEPRELSSGEYVLPLEVLDDPAHESKRDALAALPRRDVALSDFPPG